MQHGNLKYVVVMIFIYQVIFKASKWRKQCEKEEGVSRDALKYWKRLQKIAPRFLLQNLLHQLWLFTFTKTVQKWKILLLNLDNHYFIKREQNSSLPYDKIGTLKFLFFSRGGFYCHAEPLLLPL